MSETFISAIFVLPEKQVKKLNSFASKCKNEFNPDKQVFSKAEIHINLLYPFPKSAAVWYNGGVRKNSTTHDSDEALQRHPQCRYVTRRTA